MLPSGTEIKLPFTINAPFLQNTDRTAIKDPEVSSCNRWLLERAGILAGKSIISWLQNKNLTIDKRVDAYKLLREPIRDAYDIVTSSTQIVMDSLLSVLENKSIIINTEGELVSSSNCTALPVALFRIWETPELKSVFARNSNCILAPDVSQQSITVLEMHRWIKAVSIEDALLSLSTIPFIPKPTSWLKLQYLWEWVQKSVNWDWNKERRRAMRIVPAEGQLMLQPGKELIRISSRGQQLSDEDWNFISGYALAIDQEWLSHLAKLKSRNEDDTHPAQTLLEALGLDEASQVDRIASQASRQMQKHSKISMVDCIRIAHIFAQLDANVPDDFKYITEDTHCRDIKEYSIVFDPNGKVECLVPKGWALKHLLHHSYMVTSKSCCLDRWLKWACSTKSKLHTFIPIVIQPKRFYYRSELEKYLISRGGSCPKEYRYKNDKFIADDANFPLEILNYWNVLFHKDPKLVKEVVKGLLFDPIVEWLNNRDVTVRQISTGDKTSILILG